MRTVDSQRAGERDTPTSTPAPASLAGGAGNQAMVALMRTVAREPAPASMPEPATSEPAAAGASEVIHFEGKALRFDRAALLEVLTSIETTQGLEARGAFVGRFRGAAITPGVLKGDERAGLFQDIVHGLDDASAQLDHEHEEFLKTFESQSTDAARALLDESEAKLRAESERLGLSVAWQGGPAVGGDAPGRAIHTLGNKDEGGKLKAAATALLPLATIVETTGRESAAALDAFEKASVSDPFGLSTKPLFEESEARRKRWQEALDAYEQARRPQVAAQPSLAMYADEPGSAPKLRKLAAMSDADLGDAMGREIAERLENIETVRPELGKRFSVWGQPHLRRVTLDQMAATPLQRELVDKKAHEKAAQAESDKLLFTLLAIGLGIAAAIPTGGIGLLAEIGAAAAATGAGLALYQLGEEMGTYSLAAAANATDFDKAKAISGNEPDAMSLAMAVVGAIGDVFAAAHAFKALKGVWKAAKAGDVRAAIQFASVAESVGVSGAAKQQLVAEAVAGLTDEAIEEVAKTTARAGDMGKEEAVRRMVAGLGEHSQFKTDLVAAQQLMEHVSGRIPDAAREMIASGRVRVFNEASLMDVFGEELGAARWQKLNYADGFYDKGKDIIFMRGGSPESIAGGIMHEATHRIGQANPLRGNDFVSEAVAEMAERDFYISLYHEGGPLAGRAPSSPHIQNMLNLQDEALLADIEKRYFDAKANMAPEKRVFFLNIGKRTPEEIVKELFDDIAADYARRLPTE